MKNKLLVFVVAILPGGLYSQTIIGSSAFFDPDFKVRRPGSTGSLVGVVVTNTPVSATQSGSGNTWQHSAGGFAQTRVTVPALANFDVQLASFTQTSGDSLVFGREITTNVQTLGIGNPSATLQTLVNNVVGASVLYNWQSNAAITGLAIAPEQLYRVNFNVTSGAGLPVDVLDSATFGITTAGVVGASNESAQLLNVLDLLSIGSGSSTGEFSFLFKSPTALNQLDFQFAASTGVGVSALGGTSGNQNVLTFSGLSVTQVPEPSAVGMSLVAGILVLGRRRR